MTAHVMSASHSVGLGRPLLARQRADFGDTYAQLHNFFLNDDDERTVFDEETNLAIRNDIKIVARKDPNFQEAPQSTVAEQNPAVMAVAMNEFSGPKNQMLRLARIAIVTRRTLKHHLTNK